MTSQLPSPTTMYRALVNRDKAFEGVFFAGVKTTGIFCRPTCPSKKPKSENIEYFRSPEEALYAGYRPCERCRPLEREKKPPELVQKLCELVENAPTERIRDAELRRLGIEPSTARRQFQRYFGMTFHAYHRARRMGAALRVMRQGETVIGAQIDHGFDSASGFWKAFRQVFGTPPSKAGAVACLYARWLETPLGAMLALAGDDGLYLLEFVDRRGLEKEILAIRKRAGCVVVPGNNRHLDQVAREVKAYFDGVSLAFEVPLVVGGSQFERVVWAQLGKIKPGKTSSYIEIARRVGKPSASRAVGRANGRNCIALAIPCHRVIASDGSLSGYGGGVWRKKWLLEHEWRVVTELAEM